MEAISQIHTHDIMK